MKEKICFSWSSGKDSSIALYKLLNSTEYNDIEVVSLFTTISEYDRIFFHGVKRILLEQQAASLGIPLYSPVITTCDSIEEFAVKLEEKLKYYIDADIKTIVYGDIYLEDLKNYRLKTLNKLGMNSIFPIWKQDCNELLKQSIDLGFKSVVTCVDSKVLDKSFVGRTLDYDFIKDLPSNVDPCGENGEFHTFTYDGPIFKEPVLFESGEISLRNNFYCIDLLPVIKLDISEKIASFINEENIEKIKTLSPLMQKEIIWLYEECEKIGLHFSITSARRTYQQQTELYNQYHQLYPLQVSIPGNSGHEKGVAVDIKIGESLSNSTEYDKVAKIWKRKGFYWGGDDINEYWHFDIGYKSSSN